MKTKKVMMIALVSSALALSGCGAMGTAIKKRNLEVKTQMSETIWLEPASERTVFLQIKNTSDKDMSGLQGKIADAVKAKGYQIVTSPDKAYYWIQANVLKADKMDLREAQGFLKTGYEGAAMGAALGAAGSVLQTGGLSARDVVLALMVGNILSTPMRAIRHQLPSYSGFFRPALALRLILANQGLRAASMTVVTLVYYFCT